jgi:MFS family permease
MNVSISQLVADFDTTVTAIQAVIALYALVMAGLMLTGGKVGDLIGRRRAFAIGLCIYAVGSALTAASWSVPSLAVGWSVLEGIGAALVLPAMVALVAGNFQGQDRAVAYGVLGGVAGAGIAVGPILGGWATTELSWRVVFAGEVVVAIGIFAGLGLIEEPPRAARVPALDWVGSVLSAAGLGTLVLGVLEASNWGWLHPRSSPVEPFGFALTPFVIAAGALILVGFVRWERRREERGEDPLVHLDLLRLPTLRGGVAMLLAQNLVLMGVFFTVPLFLQIVLGLDALETGVRMLPASVGLFASALIGSALAKRFPARTLVRAGVVVVFVATLLLLDTVEPELDNSSFLIAMGVLGVGMGLIVSQLGNVVQSAVGDADRSEAGGLQNTAQQLGSSLGTALLGAIVISGLLLAFTTNVGSNPQISAAVREQVEVHVAAGAGFVPASQVEATAREAGVPEPTVAALVDDYGDAQIAALKTAFLCAALLTLASFFATRNLPRKRFDQMAAPSVAPPPDLPQPPAEPPATPTAAA